jgi:large subunit ribosomal protein L20
VKRGFAAHRRHKKILTLAKGYRGARRKLFKTANEAVMRALAYSYRHRRERKRDFHRLWIVRINAAARQNGVSYSQFMHGLKLASVELDRKVLAELAVNNPAEFTRLAGLARDPAGNPPTAASARG